MIFARAVKSCRTGNFVQATGICKGIIKRRPDHAEAFRPPGLISVQDWHCDTAWRAQISQKITGQKCRLYYNDKTCIRGTEDFPEKAVRERA